MQKKVKILTIAGARPNFIKITPLLEEFKKHKIIKSILVHTGQHYDFEMSKVFFQDLNIPRPDYNLEVGSGSHGWQTAKVMEKLEPIILKEKPNLIIVVGDVNSTLATALTAVKLHIPIAHIEAGCRDFDMFMPEEVNRLLTDHISDFLFTTSYFENRNLIKEGINRKKIFLVGNIMTDTLMKSGQKIQRSKILKNLNLKKKKYAVLTLHRAENVDNKKNLKEILEAVSAISHQIPVVFPIHPRTQKMIKKNGFQKFLLNASGIISIKPLSYINMVNLVKNAKLVLTDSGGLQHETTVLGVPCLTLHKTTGWQITLDQGTNLLVGISKERIIREAVNILNNRSSYLSKKRKMPKYWDGKTSQKIIRILLKYFYKKSRRPHQ